MELTFKAEVISKDGNQYTRFKLHKQVFKELIKKICKRGGKKVSENKYYCFIELKGNKISLIAAS